ncbi:MAG: hypothetical protein R3C01_03175 [Planctomycetaceae bacterium]
MCNRKPLSLSLCLVLNGLCLFGLLVPQSASAQLPMTRLKSVFPAGGEAGQSVELKLTSGEDLEEVTALHFNHPGIKSVLQTRDVNGKAEPVDNTFNVTIAADVPVGIYEVRAIGLFGVSNPRRFVVGSRPEFVEDNKNNTPEEAAAIDVNSTINGKMDGATDIDYFKFSAKQGETIVADCWATRIDSLLTPLLTVHDATGRQLATSANRPGLDATLPFVVPADGEYIIRLNDNTYGGGGEYVYRLDLHRGPQIVFTSPSVGTAGKKQRFVLFGFNLPGGQPSGIESYGVPLQKQEVDIDVPADSALLDVENLVRSFEAGTDAFSYRLSSPQGVSNPVRIGITELPIQQEQEPNNDPAQANAVTLPVEYAGQFLQRGDIDWVTFEAKAGEVYWLEVVGQRHGSTLDPVITVEQVTVDAEGKETVKRITTQDDNATNLAANIFDTQTDDPSYRLQVPADGKYRVSLFDRYRFARGDVTLNYRLAIRPEQPDFRVIAVPTAPSGNSGTMAPVSIRKGDSVGVELFAFRRDGFEGPIHVNVEGLPAGVTCSGTTIGTKESTSTLVLVAADNAPESVSLPQIRATANIDSPVAIKAIEEARKGLEAAQKSLPDLRKKADDLRQKRDAAAQQRDDAKKASDEKPDDAGLKAQFEQKQKVLDQAEAAYQPAADALAAGEAAVATSKTAVDTAETQRQQAARKVTRSVREGTIMVNGANNVPARARVSATFAVAVLKEAAPFQLVSEGLHVEACQSRQVLVPIKLVKRNGFDDKVQLTTAGLPKTSNIQVDNIAIEKGSDSAMALIQIKDNSPPGTYTFWFNSLGSVEYVRNPDKAERLKQARDAAAALLKSAQEAQTQATDAKNKATQAAKDALTKLQQAQQAKTQADQVLQQKEKEKTAAAALVTAATQKLATATSDLQVKEKELAEAKAKAEAAADDADLKTKLQQAEQALEAAKRVVEAETKTVNDLTKKAADSEIELTKATEAQKLAADAVKTADDEKQVSEKARTDSEAAEKLAIDAAKGADAAAKAADKLATDAATAAKPKKLNFTPVTSPVVIDVVPSPMKLAANVPGGGAIKQGGNIEVKVTVTRQNGYEGPVSVSLPLPPGVAGLSGSAEIPADQNETMLTISATGDAPEGEVKFLVVRGTSLAGPKLAVDVPVTLKVSK